MSDSPSTRKRPAPAKKGGRSRRRWLLPLGVLAAACALAAAALLPPLRVRLDRQQGLQLARQDRFAEAEPLLVRALEAHPDDAEVARALATGALAARQFTRADLYLQHWADARPADPEPYRLRMAMWQQQGQVPQVVAEGLRLLEREPDDVDVRARVAHGLLLTGRPEEAERHCRQCLQRRPGQPELLYLLAVLEHHTGRNRDAEALLDALLASHPGFPQAVLLRGIVYAETDRPEQAVAALREALGQPLDPAARGMARYHLALVLGRLGQAEEARRLMAEVQWQQALDLLAKDEHRDNPELHVRIAEGMLGAGQADQGRQLLEEVLKRRPDYAPAHRALAGYYEGRGQAELAAEHRRRAAP